MSRRRREGEPPWLLTLVFLLGGAVSLLMVARSQVAGDQLNLLARGWLLIEEGVWVPYGNPMSTGGATPGGLTSLLVALPLALWEHHRAGALGVWLTHLLAFLVLDRVVREAAGPRGRLLFALLYWLNPWRLYFSGFLWNPNFLFLLGAVHAWTAYRLRERPAFGWSLLHALTLALAFQIHASFLLLVLASGVLWLRRHLRLSPAGAAAGVVLGGATLLPWVLAALRDPGILPTGEGFPGRGLALVYPLARGLLYWLRYPSLAVSGEMACFDFSSLVPGGPAALLGGAAEGLVGILGPPTAAAALWANLRLWRSGRTRLRGGGRPPGTGRGWLAGYARWTFAAVALGFALSPTTVMMWQGFAVLHAAVLPPVLLATALLRTRWGGWTRRAVASWAALALLLSLALALAGPHYRCGGPACGSRNAEMPPLRSHHPMLGELGIETTCPVEVDVPGGWWPDVLPEGGGPRRAGP